MRVHLIAVMACLMLGAGLVASAQETPEGPGEESPPGKPRISFKPEKPVSGDRLTLHVQLGAHTLWAVTTWKRNGVYVGENRSTKEDKYVAYKGKLSGGDEIEASVVPFSPFSVEGEPVTVKVTVNKAPPDLKLVSQEITGQVYRAVVKATDHDGGPLVLALKEGPPGMTISQDGKITWRVDPSASGRVAVVVSCKDKLGCEAVMSYSFGVRRPGR